MEPAKSLNPANSEVERICKEVRDKAIKETEAKYKRKVQETFQCVVCLHVPRDGHITQCQNGHLLCEVCANKNNNNQCPSCRAEMDQLNGDKRIRTLAAEQLIESMDLSFPCKHPLCQESASKKEIIIHEKKCKNRMVPCPDNCNMEIVYHGLLEHLKDSGCKLIIISQPHSGYTRKLSQQNTDFHFKNLRWPCNVLNVNLQTFILTTRKIDGIFYSYMQILGDEEEAKKFKVALSIGNGGQSGLAHIGRVFPIDAKREDIIKEKSGVLSFSPTGMGEMFFEVKSEDKKVLHVTTRIFDAEEKSTHLSKNLDPWCQC